MQKEWEQKIPKKRFAHLWLSFQKKIDPCIFGSTTGTEIAREGENYSKLKEYKITLQWVKLRLHLLSVQNDHGKIYFTLTRKILDTSTLTNWLTSLQHWFVEENVHYTWSKKCKAFRHFVHSLKQMTTRIWKTRVKKWRQSSHLEV